MSFFSVAMEKKKRIQKSLEKALSFEGYISLIEKLHLENKATSFQDNEEFFTYSKLGLTRMLRVFKTIKLAPEISLKVTSIVNKQTWLLITESWCGDASQTVPIIAKLADLNAQVELKIVLRDSNEELMKHYLTNGAESIPILAILDKNLEEIGLWGPRPEPAQKKVLAYKNLKEPKPPYSELSTEIQKWYNKDKGALTLTELLEII
ncbi:MAG TPA: thioredoxin family protein [Flavobacteriales bacterium]|nr:thioredoxin family protein [Flavobacteriales bacterium]|tara:strand:- start:18121 stop:18741 length:621 start_codon:yes stop_codon:yes gene_type:complete